MAGKRLIGSRSWKRTVTAVKWQEKKKKKAICIITDSDSVAYVAPPQNPIAREIKLPLLIIVFLFITISISFCEKQKKWFIQPKIGLLSCRFCNFFAFFHFYYIGAEIGVKFFEYSPISTFAVSFYHLMCKKFHYWLNVPFKALFVFQ